MKLSPLFYGVVSVAITSAVIAAEPAPVIDASQPSVNSANTSSLQQRVENLERQVAAQNRKQVSNQRTLDELQNELSELRGVTELHTHQLSQILERQRELYQELDRRVSQALKPSNPVPTAIEAPTTATPTADYSNNVSENEAYDNAVNLVLKEKQYDKAIPAFTSFIEQFPQSSYAANAHYWLGQLLFTKGDLAKSKAQFAIVVNDYADSAKRSDAMLKLATVEQKQNNKSRAVSLYQQLVKEYPNSSAAKLAQPRLDAML